MRNLKSLAARVGLATLTLASASPAFAQTTAGDTRLTSIPTADRLTLGGVFAHASIPMKVVLWGLVAAAIAGGVIWFAQLVRIGQRRPDGIASGGMAYLSAQAAAAPLFGLFGTAYALLNGFIGIANVRPTPSLTVLAPGLAEAALSLCLGLLAAAIAVVGHRHLTVRLQGLEQTDPAAAQPTAPSTHPPRAIA